jgi:nicotinamide-nucleotide adenylyltransferase
LSALTTFFDAGHKLLVLLRPDSSSDNAVTGDTKDEQRAYIAKLAEGSLKKEGMKEKWALQIGILEGDKANQAVGISSTVIRRAAKQHDWAVVEKMCTSSVAEWIKYQKLYENDSGSKMV